MVHEVKVYTTPTWPWCIKVKQLLDENKIPYQNIDVTQDKAGREEMVNKTGKLVVPVVEIDGQIREGFDQSWIKSKLELI